MKISSHNDYTYKGIKQTYCKFNGKTLVNLRDGQLTTYELNHVNNEYLFPAEFSVSTNQISDTKRTECALTPEIHVD